MNLVLDIQLFWLLVPYGLLLLVLSLFTLMNLYHIIRWGGFTFVGFVATFIFLAGVVLILFFTYDNLKLMNWSETIYSFSGLGVDVNMGF